MPEKRACGNPQNLVLIHTAMPDATGNPSHSATGSSAVFPVAPEASKIFYFPLNYFLTNAPQIIYLHVTIYFLLFLFP